jgi:hypothetical protein
VIWWFTSASRPRASASDLLPNSPTARADDSDYVGSDACKDCHEDQFKAFSVTSHAHLANIKSWKGKVTGCEACHGPGKAHVEEGDPTKIISFKNKSAKEISETCLLCHGGKEERNNFRRGEHWRNDIGCTDCHSSHFTATNRNLPKSITFVGPANAEKPDFSTIHLLKLVNHCSVSCHGEVKPDFNKPFHHKVRRHHECSDATILMVVSTQQTISHWRRAACIKCRRQAGPFT